MEQLLVAVGIIALLTCIGSVVWLLATAWRTSIMWGLAYSFIPFASIAFVVMHWDKAKKPFFVFLGGMAVSVLIAFLMPSIIEHAIGISDLLHSPSQGR
jgi:hypothetical protein